MSLSDGIKRLIDRLADIEKRLLDIEERLDELLVVDEYEIGQDQIGFDLGESDDFDEDASEYRRGK